MARKRRAAISSQVTIYRFATPDSYVPFKGIVRGRDSIGTRANPQKVEQRPTHEQPLPTRAERDAAIIAAHGGTSRPTHSTSWDQDN